MLKRRFGDCKDKSLLLISLLRALGHQAWPALVNTDSRHAIESWLPSPYDFDHVVVALEWEGRLIFIDPTRNLQRGPLNQIYIEDYERTLLVREGETGLVELHPQPASLPRTEITETFHCPSADGEATLRVRTLHRGASAEDARSELADSSLQNLQESYLEFYAHAHPLIRVTEPISWKDDPEANTVECIESYAIRDLWKKTDSGSREAEFYPQYIRDQLERPNQAERKGPFAVSHPTNVSQETRIELWQKWDIQEDSETIDSPAFRYENGASMENEGRTVIYRDHYFTKKDHATAGEVPGYLKSMDKVYRALGHTLEHDIQPDTSTGKTSHYGLLTACLLLAGLASAGWALAARRGRPPGTPPPLPLHPTTHNPWLPLRVPLLGVALIGSVCLAIHPVWSAGKSPWYTEVDYLRLILLIGPVWPLWIMLHRKSPRLTPAMAGWIGLGILIVAGLFPFKFIADKDQWPGLALQMVSLSVCGISLARCHFRSRNGPS